MSEQMQVEPEATKAPTSTEGDELSALVQKARAHIEAGDPNGGLAAFQEIADRFPDIPEVFNNLGAICSAMQRLDEAERAFDRAIELSPDNANAHFNRGMIQFQRGKHIEAYGNFNKANELSPDDPETCNNLGVSCFQLERWDEARRAFEAAVRARPDYTAAQLNLVDVDLAEDKYEDAFTRARDLAAETREEAVWERFIHCALLRAEASMDAVEGACERALEFFPQAEEIRAAFGRTVRARQMLTAGPEETAPAVLPR